MQWYEKHKPKTLTEMVGHKEIFAEIEGFILSGDIPPLLFWGKPGTGKTLTAEVIAYMILGDEPNGNFIPIDASNDRTIEKMRKRVINAIRNMPLFAPIKIIFLDEADGLLSDAQDILKTPVQKAKTTLFIFACNDPSKIIPAIVSRCRVYEFKPLTEADIIQGLKRIMVKENVTLDDSILRDIAKKSQGDMRAAINELQGIAATNNRSSEIDKIVQQYMNKEAAGV